MTQPNLTDAIGKALLEHMATEFAQRQAAAERGEQEAGMLASGASHAACAQARQDKNVQCLVLAGIPFGLNAAGKRLEDDHIGMAIACAMEGSPVFLQAVASNHIPRLMDQFHIGLWSRLRICWVILFGSRAKEFKATFEDTSPPHVVM